MQSRYRLASMTKDQRHAEYNAVLHAIPHYWPSEKKIILSEVIDYAKMHADSDPVLTNITRASHEKFLTKFFSNDARDAVTLARYDVIQSILDGRYLPTNVFLNLTIEAIKSKTELHSRLRNTVLPEAENFLKMNMDDSEKNLFLTGLAAAIFGLFAMGLDFNSYSAGLLLFAAGSMALILNQQIARGELLVSHDRFNALPKPQRHHDMSHLQTGSLYDAGINFMGKVKSVANQVMDEKLKEIEGNSRRSSLGSGS